MSLSNYSLTKIFLSIFLQSDKIEKFISEIDSSGANSTIFLYVLETLNEKNKTDDMEKFILRFPFHCLIHVLDKHPEWFIFYSKSLNDDFLQRVKQRCPKLVPEIYYNIAEVKSGEENETLEEQAIVLKYYYKAGDFKDAKYKYNRFYTSYIGLDISQEVNFGFDLHPNMETLILFGQKIVSEKK